MPDSLHHWQRWSVDSLFSLWRRDGLPTRALDTHGIYMFVRQPVSIDGFRKRPAALAAELAQFTSRPCSTIIKFDHQNHFIDAHTQLQLRPRDRLSSDRIGSMSAAYFDALLGALADAPPLVLYCGESHNLLERLVDHFSGSPVWKRLQDAGYQPKDLAYWAYPLPPTDDPNGTEVTEARRLVELLLTVYALAPFTIRAG